MSYIVGPPVKHPDDFYGRSFEVARFYEILGGTQAQSISLLGLRRAGKTSFLQYISHPEVMSRYLRRPDAYMMVYVDMSSCKTPGEFYGRLLTRLNALLKPSAVNLWKTGELGKSTMYDVETVLCQFPDKRIVLLLDEFDKLRIGAFDQDFLTELRAMTSVLDYDLACVTASFWDLYFLGSKIGLPPTSPFYNIFYPTPIYLAGLPDADIDQLIHTPAKEMGIYFTADDMRQIRYLSGTLPFFIQMTASHCVSQLKQGEALDFNQILRQLVADLSPYFDQWWRMLDGPQKAVLTAIVQRTVPDGDYGDISLKEALRALVNLGLMIEENRQYKINGRIFYRWIEQTTATAEVIPQTSHSNGFKMRDVRLALIRYFSMEELRTLCFDLHIDFEELPGSEKRTKARALVEYLQNRQNLPQLVEAIRLERGQII